MTGKFDREAENRGVRYQPSKRPNHFAQQPKSKPPDKKDRERDDEDNKTA
jgi:hypothetical protein